MRQKAPPISEAKQLPVKNKLPKIPGKAIDFKTLNALKGITTDVHKLQLIVAAIVLLRNSQTEDEHIEATGRLNIVLKNAGLYDPTPEVISQVDQFHTLMLNWKEKAIDADRFQAKVGQLLEIGETASKSQIIEMLENSKKEASGDFQKRLV